MTARYQLRRIQVPRNAGNSQDIVLLDKDVVRFGRNPDQVDVTLNSYFYPNMISRNHAEIRKQRNEDGSTGFYVIDRSLNGTYVNGYRVQGEVLLHPSDSINFGHVNGAAIQPGKLAPQPDAEFTYVFEKINRTPVTGAGMQGVGGLETPSTYQAATSSAGLTSAATQQHASVIQQVAAGQFNPYGASDSQPSAASANALHAQAASSSRIPGQSASAINYQRLAAAGAASSNPALAAQFGFGYGANPYFQHPAFAANLFRQQAAVNRHAMSPAWMAAAAYSSHPGLSGNSMAAALGQSAAAQYMQQHPAAAASAALSSAGRHVGAGGIPSQAASGNSANLLYGQYNPYAAGMMQTSQAAGHPTGQYASLDSSGLASVSGSALSSVYGSGQQQMGWRGATTTTPTQTQPPAPVSTSIPLLTSNVHGFAIPSSSGTTAMRQQAQPQPESRQGAYQQGSSPSPMMQQPSPLDIATTKPAETAFTSPHSVGGGGGATIQHTQPRSVPSVSGPLSAPSYVQKDDISGLLSPKEQSKDSTSLKMECDSSVPSPPAADQKQRTEQETDEAQALNSELVRLAASCVPGDSPDDNFNLRSSPPPQEPRKEWQTPPGTEIIREPSPITRGSSPKRPRVDDESPPPEPRPPPISRLPPRKRKSNELSRLLNDITGPGVFNRFAHLKSDPKERKGSEASAPSSDVDTPKQSQQSPPPKTPDAKSPSPPSGPSRRSSRSPSPVSPKERGRKASRGRAKKPPKVKPKDPSPKPQKSSDSSSDDSDTAGSPERKSPLRGSKIDAASTQGSRRFKKTPRGRMKQNGRRKVQPRARSSSSSPSPPRSKATPAPVRGRGGTRKFGSRGRPSGRPLKKKKGADSAPDSSVEISFHDPTQGCGSKGNCLRPDDELVNWVQCDDCDLWFHTDCVGYQFDEVTGDDTAFHCGCL